MFFQRILSHSFRGIMNIFVLDENPFAIPRMMLDKHAVKMVLETAQMLCTAHRVLDNLDNINGTPLYKAAHVNHPCSIWVRESLYNYRWLYNHFMALCTEYTYRYKKSHLCATKLLVALRNPPINIPVIPRTPFALAMPDYCKSNCAITSYRTYYCMEKSSLPQKWTNRTPPAWYSPAVQTI